MTSQHSCRWRKPRRNSDNCQVNERLRYGDYIHLSVVNLENGYSAEKLISGSLGFDSTRVFKVTIRQFILTDELQPKPHKERAYSTCPNHPVAINTAVPNARVRVRPQTPSSTPLPAAFGFPLPVLIFPLALFEKLVKFKYVLSMISQKAH